MYWMAIDMVEGREMLMALKVSAYPHVKTQKDADKVWRETHKLAYPYGFENIPVMTTGEIFGAFSG